MAASWSNFNRQRDYSSLLLLLTRDLHQNNVSQPSPTRKISCNRSIIGQGISIKTAALIRGRQNKSPAVSEKREANVSPARPFLRNDPTSHTQCYMIMVLYRTHKHVLVGPEAPGSITLTWKNM